MQTGNTLVSSQLHTPGAFSGSSSSCGCSPSKGILSDRKKPPRPKKKVSFDEASLAIKKRRISITSLKWQDYIEEQFRTLRAHRKRKSKRENDSNVYQEKHQIIPRNKNKSKRQESNGSAHLSDVNMFELPKTGIRVQEEPERWSMQKEDCYTTFQSEPSTSSESREHDASMKLVKPKRPLNAFFVFVQHCRKQHVPTSIRPSQQSSKALGRVWRYMSRDERYVFYLHAERLRVEYYRQKGKWEKRMAQFPAARKRPLNGYTLFCREHFSLVRFKMSHAHPCLVIVRLAGMWRRLRRAQKLAYKRQARAATRPAIPDLVAMTPTYVHPTVAADVPGDKPDYISSEVPADEDEPNDVASKVSSREPAEYSDYRSVDPSVDDSSKIYAPVEISSTINAPVDISNTIDAPVEIFSTIDAPVEISSTINGPVDISITIDAPVDIPSTIDAPVDISSTIDAPVDISSTIDAPVDISSTIDAPVDIPSTIDAPVDISSTIDAPVDISNTIDPPGDVSTTIDGPVDISSTIDGPVDIFSTIDAPVDISDTFDGIVDVSNTVDPDSLLRTTSEEAPPEKSSVRIISQDKDNYIIIGAVPYMTGKNMEWIEGGEISEIEETNDNTENKTSLTVDSGAELRQRKPSVLGEQDGNNSKTSGGLLLGTNYNNTWSDVSDCDGQPSPNLPSKMDNSLDDDALSQSSRTPAMTPSTCAGSSVLTLTSVSRDSAVNARIFHSTCTVDSDPALAAVFSGIKGPVPQSSSHPLPTCSTNQEHTTRINRRSKSRARRLKRRPRRVRKINMEMPERTLENTDFHLTTVSEKSSAEDFSCMKPRNSMHDYMSAMSDDELPFKIMRDSKLKRYLLELKALKPKYKPAYNAALLRSNTALDVMSELDLYFATAEASLDSEDSLTSVLSSDSEEILYAMQSKAKSTPSDNDLAFVDDLTSNSSDSLSFCFISSHLLVTPSASATVQQVFKARAEAAIELGSMNMSATFVNNEPSPSYRLNASGKNGKRKVPIFGDQSLNHTQKTSLLYNLMKDKKVPFAHCAYLRPPCQPNTPLKYPCTQPAKCPTAPWSVIQDELSFSSSEAQVPEMRNLTGQVQNRNVMTCSQPSPKAHKQRPRSPQAERPQRSRANARRRRDERRKVFTEHLSPTKESCRASCPLKCKEKSSFIHLSGSQQASIVPMAKKVDCKSTQAPDGVTSCRGVSVSSGIKHGEGEADQNKCESGKKPFDEDILRLSAKLQLVSLSEQRDSNSDLDTIKSIASFSSSLKSSSVVTEEESSALESTSGSAAKVRFAYSQHKSLSLRSDIGSRSARSHGCSADSRPFGDDDRDICTMVIDDEGVLETPADYPSCQALKKKKLGFASMTF